MQDSRLDNTPLGALSLLLGEEVEQSNNTQIGDDPQHEGGNQRHQGKVGAGQHQGENQRECLKPKRKTLFEKRSLLNNRALIHFLIAAGVRRSGLA